MTEPLWKLSATELQRRYRERSLAPRAVVDAVLARIDAVDGRLGAVVARRDDAVRAEADAATRRFAEGRPLSALDGIPLTLKDSLFSADGATTCGTAALRDFHAGHDELAWAARVEGMLKFLYPPTHENLQEPRR